MALWTRRFPHDPNHDEIKVLLDQVVDDFTNPIKNFARSDRELDHLFMNYNSND